MLLVGDCGSAIVVVVDDHRASHRSMVQIVVACCPAATDAATASSTTSSAAAPPIIRATAVSGRSSSAASSSHTVATHHLPQSGSELGVRETVEDGIEDDGRFGEEGGQRFAVGRQLTDWAELADGADDSVGRPGDAVE